jgi:hypothetical protein
VSTTASGYINNIDRSFPIPGQDNNSQGFRDNWTNIANALTEINSATSYLGFYAVDVTNTTTSFSGNTISDVNLLNFSESLWDNGTQSGDITIDYSLGNYQNVRLNSGVHNITITNWPGQGRASDLTLMITPVGSGATSVNFVGATALGPSSNPYLLTAPTNVFTLINEFSTLASTSTTFVKLVNELVVSSTSTIQQVANTYVVAAPTDVNSTDQFYSISSSTGANGSLVVNTQFNSNLVAANVAFTPNFVTANTVYGNWSSPTNTTATQFQVNSVNGIIVGATFGVNTTGTLQTVTVVNDVNQTITCTPGFPTGIGTGTKIIFRNPSFHDYSEDTAFPVLATMSNNYANTFSGTATNFNGAIYANKNYLEITYADFGQQNSNTFVASTLAINTVTDNSSNLANTQFIHQVLPYGSIIMWYGSVASIPYGWALCDGTNGTPNLVDQFIIGAGADNAGLPTTSITGSPTSLGGSKDSIVPLHTHATVEPNDGAGHEHQVNFYNSTGTATTVTSGPNLAGSGNETQLVTTYTLFANANITIASTGTSTTNTNLPPYHALCYIMKISGNVATAPNQGS